MRRFLLLLVLLAACERAEPYRPAERPDLPGLGVAQAPGPVRQSNADLADDFVDLVFFPENGPELDRLLRFETPVRVSLTGTGLDLYAPDLDRLLDRMRAATTLDIRRTEDAAAANIRIVLAPRSEMQEVFPGAQCFILPGLYTWGSFLRALRTDALTEWDELDRLTGATIFIPGSGTPNEIRECFAEEIAQALGPANDLFRLPDTVFNDDNVHANLTRFDLLMLRVLYDPRLASGMNQRDARVAARVVLDEVNPEGRRQPRRRGLRPDPEWERMIRDLYESTEPREAQKIALRQALKRAETLPQPDHRLAHTLDMLASAEYPDRPELSEGLLQRAVDSLLTGYPKDDLRIATLRLYLAQTKLKLGKADPALRLADQALPVLIAHDTPLRIAHALQIRASALDDLGKADEAVRVAIDSLRWARYAQGADFGNLAALQARLEEIKTRGPGG